MMFGRKKKILVKFTLHPRVELGAVRGYIGFSGYSGRSKKDLGTTRFTGFPVTAWRIGRLIKGGYCSSGGAWIECWDGYVYNLADVDKLEKL